ncbi:serine protease [Actinoplanes sp. ATCC 53533]|nr:serine protease [Actinoplanes sp. ATCC 53533]
MIAPTWVLTARHCLADAGETTAVRIGGLELSASTRIAVDCSEVPPAAGDVALLHLSVAASASAVRLADADPPQNSTGTMYGWGAEKPVADGEKALMSPALKNADMWIYSASYPDGDGGAGLSSWSINDTGMGYKGDSGGPLLVGGVQVGAFSTALNTNSSGMNDHASVAGNRAWIVLSQGVEASDSNS